MEKSYEPQNITRQLMFRELGMLGTFNGKVYHQLVALQELMGDFGEERCKQILGEKEYEVLLKRLIALEKVLHRINTYYDFLEEDKINREDKTSVLFVRYRRELEDLVPSLYYPMLAALMKLTRETIFWHQNLPAEVFKKLERKYQKVDYKEKIEGRVGERGAE